MEWNALLAMALVLFALPVSVSNSLPSAWGATNAPWVAALTASSAPTQYSAMLWWLQNSATNLEPSALPSAATSDLSASEIDALLLNLETAVAVRANIDEAISGYERIERIAGDDVSSAAGESLTTSLVPSPVHLPRYDATLRLARHSLSAHEAGFRSGARSNRYLE